MGDVLKGKRIKMGVFVLRDTLDELDAIAIEDEHRRLIGYIYGKRPKGEPYIRIIMDYLRQENEASEVFFKLRPLEKKYCPTCGQEIEKE